MTTLRVSTISREEKQSNTLQKSHMKNKTIISEGIEQFHFYDDHKPKMDVNITVLISGDTAMLIDTGYIRHAEEVLAELKERNIKVTDIVLSHYHPDHAAGASVFKGANCYCSEYYFENYRMCSEVWDKNTSYIKATGTIKVGQTLEFGIHRLKFYESKAHSLDSLIIDINEEFLLVGDLIMKDVEDMITYPYICKDGNIHGYLESLKLIIEMRNHKLLLAHGKPVKCAAEIEAIVTDHKKYFDFLRTQEDINKIQASLPHWSFAEWHENNLKFFNAVI